MLLGYNMTYETMLVIGIPGLRALTTGNTSTFHLSDLGQQWLQAVDHDASLSREDAYFGGDGDFSEVTWRRTLKSWGDIEIVDVCKNLASVLFVLCTEQLTQSPSESLQQRQGNSRTAARTEKSTIPNSMGPLLGCHPCFTMV